MLSSFHAQHSSVIVFRGILNRKNIDLILLLLESVELTQSFLLKGIQMLLKKPV